MCERDGLALEHVPEIIGGTRCASHDVCQVMGSAHFIGLKYTSQATETIHDSFQTPMRPLGTWWQQACPESNVLLSNTAKQTVG